MLSYRIFRFITVDLLLKWCQSIHIVIVRDYYRNAYCAIIITKIWVITPLPPPWGINEILSLSKHTHISLVHKHLWLLTYTRESRMILHKRLNNLFLIFSFLFLAIATAFAIKHILHTSFLLFDTLVQHHRFLRFLLYFWCVCQASLLKASLAIHV